MIFTYPTPIITKKQKGNYWGDASNGDVTYSSNTNLVVPNKNGLYDGDMVVMNYRNLTINNGVTITTDQPCRGMLIYVKENCTINGTLTMTARGAYANPTVAGGSDGNAVSSNGLRFKRRKEGQTQTLSDNNLLYGCGTAAVTAENNQSKIDNNGKIYTIARTGANGASAAVAGKDTGVNGGSGSNGSTGQSGGGGAGGATTGNAGTTTSGAGSAGTCFSGGAGGGAAIDIRGGGSVLTADSGDSYGGQGGDGAVAGTTNSLGAGGGAGNPGGVKSCNVHPSHAQDGFDGTGGLIVLFVRGNLTIGATGKIEANGKDGGDGLSVPTIASGGGASGGGNILILRSVDGTYTNNGTIQANGGTGGAKNSHVYAATGGNGGTGSIQIDTVDV